MCRSDGWIGVSSTRTSASPWAKGGVGISANFNTLFGSPVSVKKHVTLFADVPQPLMNAAGGFGWDEPDIASDLLSTWKALRVSHDEHKGQRRHGPNARVSHEEFSIRPLLRLLLHSCREF